MRIVLVIKPPIWGFNTSLLSKTVIHRSLAFLSKWGINKTCSNKNQVCWLQYSCSQFSLKNQQPVRTTFCPQIKNKTKQAIPQPPPLPLKQSEYAFCSQFRFKVQFCYLILSVSFLTLKYRVLRNKHGCFFEGENADWKYLIQEH